MWWRKGLQCCGRLMLVLETSQGLEGITADKKVSVFFCCLDKCII